MPWTVALTDTAVDQPLALALKSGNFGAPDFFLKAWEPCHEPCPNRRDENRLREEIVRFGRSLFDRGLTAGSSGNISVRLDDGWLLTPTNACLGQLDPACLAKLDWQGRLLSGDPPSKEAFLHRALYDERQGAGAIVHLHATHAAAVSCIAGLDPADCLPPLTAYYVMKIGRLPLMPYFRPGDPALAEAIRGLAGKHSAVLLANHGPVVRGHDPGSRRVCHRGKLEETAKLFLLLRGISRQPAHGAADRRVEDWPSSSTSDCKGISMPKFAANLTMMFNEVPFADRFAAAAKAGFRGVGFSVSLRTAGRRRWGRP